MNYEELQERVKITEDEIEKSYQNIIRILG